MGGFEREAGQYDQEGLARAEAGRQALMAFGKAERSKEARRTAPGTALVPRDHSGR